MVNQQNVEKLWSKLIKAGCEIQHDFDALTPQEKQAFKDKVGAALKIRGIAVSVDALLNAMRHS